MVLLRLHPLTLFFPVEEKPATVVSVGVGVNPPPDIFLPDKGKAESPQADIGENCFRCLFRRVFDLRLSSALTFFFQKNAVEVTPLTSLLPKMPTPK